MRFRQSADCCPSAPRLNHSLGLINKLHFVAKGREKMRILFEDNHIIVVEKPQNIPSAPDSSGDTDMLTMVKDYIKQKYNKPGNVFIGLVHRLDRPTGGVMVFARTSKAAERLSECLREGEFDKRYYAVVMGKPREKSDRITHYLLKDEASNTVSVVPQLTAGAKEASLQYTVIESADLVSLIDVRLETGRSHQIRAQMATVGHPVFGDAKYGGDKTPKGKLALWSYQLKFPHPTTKVLMSFRVIPPVDETPWKLFRTLEANFNVL